MSTTARTPFRARMSYQGLLLAVTCLAVTLALLFGHDRTAAPIQQAILQDRLHSLAQVLPSSSYDNDPVSEAISINDPQLGETPTLVYPARRNGELTAAAFQLVKPGYGGPITLLMAVDARGEILGVRVVSHKETPVLADRIDIGKDSWIRSFDGRSLQNTSAAQWRVKKDGGEFDQFTGATITPRAVVGGVYAGLHFHQRHFAFARETAKQDNAEKASHE